MATQTLEKSGQPAAVDHRGPNYETVFWILRIGLFLCFVGHGTAGIIGKSGWLPYYRIFGIPDDIAWILMPVVGFADWALGFLLLLRPMRAAVAYAAFWTVMTAFLRPLAEQGTWQEVAERGGNYGLAIALLVLIGLGPPPRKLKTWLENPVPRAVSPAALDWVIRLCIALLLVGHAGFGLSHLHDAEWTGYFRVLGIEPSASMMLAVAWFEVALAVAVLALRSRALMIFVLAWKVATEGLRPFAGEPIYEFVERAGDYLLPLAAIVLYSGDKAPAHPRLALAAPAFKAKATALGLAIVVATTTLAWSKVATNVGSGLAAPAEPTAGEWKTWVIGSPARLAVPAPPEPGSARARADRKELQRLADRRTPLVRSAVEIWNPAIPTKPWTEKAFELVSVSAKNPPLSSRNYGLLHVAMHDATIAAWHWKYEYDVKPPEGSRLVPAGADPSYPSEHAAIAGAASELLAYLYPDRAAPLRDAAIEAADSRVQAGVNTRSDVSAGLALGKKVAARVIDRAKTDGSERVWDGSRPPGIGRGPEFWEPPPGSVSPPTAPLAGTWKTWVMRSGDQFRPPPPPAFGSPKFVKAAREVVEIRKNLTPVQKQIARFYEGAEGTSLPAGIVVDVAYGDVLKAATQDVAVRRLSVPKITRALAMINVAMSDAGISAWDAKYAYWNPRPANAIRDLGLDPSWKPLLPTPRFPAYPSGSAGYAGAAQAVMEYLFPDNAAAFRKRAEDQAASRLYAGIHWRYDSISLQMGRRIGALVVERARADGAERAA